MSTTTKPTSSTTSQDLARKFRQVRDMSDVIRQPLSAEDCMVQSMPDVSPTRWHLGHTTWFFEQFVLMGGADYQAFDEQFTYLFNSYYNQVGEQFPRAKRGLISRPGLKQVMAYREHVNRHMMVVLESGELTDEQLAIVEIGLNHEQQHQELMLTDIKHVLSCNPLFPLYRESGNDAADLALELSWVPFDEGLYQIGHDGKGFAFDNESPRHQVFCQPFELCSRPVTCGEFMQFMEDGGYRRPEHWLSMGWATVQEHGWQAPMYWSHRDGRWHQFTLAGLRPVELHQPVCHVSYFEADAYAKWNGCRLPTEAEWEVAANGQAVNGNLLDDLIEHDWPVHPASAEGGTGGELHKLFGDVWEWTASQYVAYPGYRPPQGAIGEYNGKFMCNQFVVRGGSCATPADHIRATYRNFFPPESRWQFSGFRLAR